MKSIVSTHVNPNNLICKPSLPASYCNIIQNAGFLSFYSKKKARTSNLYTRVWNIHNAEMVNNLVHHCEAVLHLRFQDGMMVTCSKDRSIAVWDMHSPTDIILRRVLVGHRAAVNVVDFDDKYIVSASGDRTIKVGSTLWLN